MKLTNKALTLIHEASKNGIRNYYTGKGKWTSKGEDRVGKCQYLCDLLELTVGRHYTIGNDAPKGGWEGNYIKLTAAGKRLKRIQNAIAEYNSIGVLRLEKQNTKDKIDNEKELKLACQARLDNPTSSQKKHLNARIRRYANLLNLGVPDANEFHDFVAIFAV